MLRNISFIYSSAGFLALVMCLGAIYYLREGANLPSYMCGNNQLSASHCTVSFVSYHPSDVEKYFFDSSLKISAYSTAQYCEFMKSVDSQKIMLEVDHVNHKSHNETRPYTYLSQFLFSKKCISCGNVVESRLVTYIEPLVGFLRHPDAVCGDKLLSKEYIVLAGAENRSTQNIFIDLGASTYDQGSGGSSQQFFFEGYERNGIHFDRALLWEADTHAPGDIFKVVPKRLFHAYQYFNIPASVELKEDHPLLILKRIAKKDDFVALKIDIDNALIENEIVKYFLNNADVLSLVDEFFFEHHVSFGPMLRYWGSVAGDLSESYDMFFKLRNKGIRAHGWV